MAAVGRNAEREVKFAVDDDFELPDLSPLGAGTAHEIVLDAEYWDTSDLRLLRWGHTLRHRRAGDGSEDGWTLKLAAPFSAGEGPFRDELDVPGPPGQPPAEVASLVQAFVRGERLARQAQIVTQRRAIVVTDGGAQVEVADDRVSSTLGAGAPGPAFRQIEVEVVGGAGTAPAERGEALLTAVGERLRAAGAGPGGTTPKLALVLGERLGAPELPAPELGPRATVADLVVAGLASGVRRLLQNDPYVRLGEDTEAVHQARVATRRLRSDLKTLAPLLPPAAVRRWRDELRRLGGVIGAVRDLDVLEDRIGAQVGALGAAEPWPAEVAALGPGAVADAGSALLRRVRAERDERRLVLLDVLASSRYRMLLDDLIGAAAAPPLASGVEPGERAGPAAARLVRRAWRRLEQSVERAGEEPADAALHEVRKRAKQARYAAELADAVLDGGTAALADRLADLQSVLGELQDAVVAAGWLAGAAAHCGDGAVGFLAGRLFEGQAATRATARAEWSGAWHRARRRSLRRAL